MTDDVTRGYRDSPKKYSSEGGGGGGDETREAEEKGRIVAEEDDRSQAGLIRPYIFIHRGFPGGWDFIDRPATSMQRDPGGC